MNSDYKSVLVLARGSDLEGRHLPPASASVEKTSLYAVAFHVIGFSPSYTFSVIALLWDFLLDSLYWEFFYS